MLPIESSKQCNLLQIRKGLMESAFALSEPKWSLYESNGGATDNSNRTALCRQFTVCNLRAASPAVPS